MKDLTVVDPVEEATLTLGVEIEPEQSGPGDIQEQEQAPMKKKKTKKVVVKKVAAKKTTKAAKKSRSVKAYKLVKGIPDGVRNPSAGRQILEAIQKRGKATTPELQDDLGKKFPSPTIRFFLGKYQREKIVKSV